MVFEGRCRGARGTEGDAAGPHAAGGRRHLAQRHLRAGAPGHLRDRCQAKAFRPPRREAARTARWAGAGRRRGGRLLHLVQQRRAAHHLLRRQPPGLRRLGGQGHGLGQGRLPPTWRPVRPSELAALAAGGQPARDGAWESSRRSWTATCAPPSCGRPLDADHRRGGGPRARGGPPVPARPVLPPAELRGAVAEVGQRATAADGRPGAHRRLGGRQGPAVADRAGDGGQLAAVRALRPGEPVVLMGPTGTPTEIPGGEAVVLCGGGLGNAVLFSIAKRAAREGLPGPVLRRLPEEGGHLQGRRDRGGHRPGHLERRRRRATRRPASAGPRLRATSSRPCSPTRAASWARRWSRWRLHAASSPSAATA